MPLHRSKQGIDGLRLNSMRRIPGEPFVGRMFAKHDRHIVYETRRTDDGRFAARLAEALALDVINRREATVVTELDINGRDTGFSLQLPQRVGNTRFAVIDVPFGQIPTVAMLHQNK